MDKNQDLTSEKRTRTVLSLLHWAEGYLNEEGIESPRITTELLLAHILHCKRTDLHTGFDRALSESDAAQFMTLLKRRAAHEPVQYITGETEFMGFSFAVDRRVLIPRPETELLVEEAVKLLQGASHQSTISVFDIGTGSGNIAVSLAKLVPRAMVVATDVSGEALNVAGSNAKRHGVQDRIRLLQHDFLGSVDELAEAPFDMILCNPPYVSKEEAQTLPPEILQFEPKQAVIEGGDGLSFYGRIGEHSERLMKKGGWLLVETAYNQGAAVQSIFSAAGLRNVELMKDYGGNDRVVKAQKVP